MTERKAVIIVPPFHSVERPSIGAHIVQALCKERGIKLEVIYFNLSFAAFIGFENYKLICESQTSLLLGESIFTIFDREAALNHVEFHTNINKTFLYSCLEKFGQMIDDFSKKDNAQIIGCSTMFQQNNASLFILNRLKKNNRNLITVLGGGGCSENQSIGLKNLVDKYYPGAVDYIFSGETELAFADKILSLSENHSNSECLIIRPEIEIIMEEIPHPDYEDFFKQAAFCEEGITPSTIWLPIEASRGCWWGMKSHCTFCALSKTGIIFRSKSFDRIHDNIRHITSQNLSKKIVFIDSIMPKDSPRSLFRHYKNKGLYFYMEHKVPLNYNDAKIMAEAGVVAIQPGIESMSPRLLKLMGKGIHPYQNIELLRFCKMFDINVEWNFLHGIPGEVISDYKELLSFLGMLEHLNAPASLSEISIDRYSPYFNTPDKYGIANMRPVKTYSYCYPHDNELKEIFGCFEGDYSRLSHDFPDLFILLEECVEYWRVSWKDNLAELTVSKIAENNYIIKDSRKEAKTKWCSVDKSRALAALSSKRIEKVHKEWAIQNKYAIMIGKIYIPLAVCAGELYEELCF